MILGNYAVEIDYTNWRGERRKRMVRVFRIKWGSTEWHPDPQWLLVATDIETGKTKEFVMAGLHGWSIPSLEDRIGKKAAP